MSRAKHDAAIDEHNRVMMLAKHEKTVRALERRRVTSTLVQPVEHEFQTPACTCGSLCGSEHLDPPGAMGTDFDGCVI